MGLPILSLVEAVSSTPWTLISSVLEEKRAPGSRTFHTWVLFLAAEFMNKKGVVFVTCLIFATKYMTSAGNSYGLVKYQRYTSCFIDATLDKTKACALQRLSASWASGISVACFRF